MKKWASIAAGLLLALTVSAVASAGPHPKKADVKSGAGADTLNAAWVTGTSQDGGANGQSLAMTDDSYYSFRNYWDQKLKDVQRINASWLLSGTNGGGSPRFSLEVDVDANGSFDCEPGPCVNDRVIYLDPTTCGDLKQGWLEADFTGDKTGCTITDSSGASFTGDKNKSAWKKLVAAYPANAKVWFLFLIQDATTGTNYVDRIRLDGTTFTKDPA